MKKLYLLAVSAALVACAENPTQPAIQQPNLGPHLTVLTPGGVDLLVCNSGTSDGGPQGGTCATSADHKKGFLNNTSSNSLGDYSSVYSLNLTVYGQELTDITDLSYHYKGSVIPHLGDLSYQIPIDLNGDGVTEFFAFVDAANCGVKIEATVNIVTDAHCGIVAGAPGDANPLSPKGVFYSNWAAFVAAYPGATVSLTDNWIFIIAERTGSEGPATWTISNVTFGKTGLICFDGTTDGGPQSGTCALGKDFKSATLSNNSSDADGDVSGVYSRELTAYGLFLTNIHDLTYKYKGPVPTLGDLSYNIPIDTDGNNNTTEFTAFVDAANCRGKLGGNSVYSVDITKDKVCGIVAGAPLDANPLSPKGVFYPNWAAFAAAYPDARISNGDWIFLIAERTPAEPWAVWTILSADWGKPGH